MKTLDRFIKAEMKPLPKSWVGAGWKKRLRQSILKKAFEGRLVPQDPADELAEKLLELIRAEKAKHQAGKRGRNKYT